MEYYPSLKGNMKSDYYPNLKIHDPNLKRVQQSNFLNVITIQSEKCPCTTDESTT